jgi:hypothetical protein
MARRKNRRAAVAKIAFSALSGGAPCLRYTNSIFRVDLAERHADDFARAV